MIVSRLFCPSMKPHEAIVIAGAEQFTQHSGYGGSLRYEGRYRDRSSINNCTLESFVVAIDALDLRARGAEMQYAPSMILRDLTKAWAGFDAPGTPTELATGNWGCGVFGGDAELKSIIQWIACSRAGKTMHYFPFDNRNVFQKFRELAADLVLSSQTVGSVAKFLFEKLETFGIYAQLGRAFRQ